MQKLFTLIAGNFEALLGGGDRGGDGDEPGGPLPPGVGNLPNVLEALGGEMEDQAMIELAIALSLQEEGGDGAGGQR